MSEPVRLHHVWDYTDVDRAFWDRHLEDWVPRRIIDAHVHVADPSLRVAPVTEAKRRQYWVNEVSEPMTASTAERACGVVFPHREVTCLAMGHPSCDYDVEASNEYVRTEAEARGWHSLALLRPQWSADRVAAELAKPGVIGVKPYYALIGPTPNTRGGHLEAGIFDFLPHHALEVLDDRRAWVTLHVPKADRLGHPDNLREVKEIRRRYPRIVLVIAHFGRCYTAAHAAEALPKLADDDGLYFDLCGVLNPATHRMGLECFGPGRVLYGTDNPVFFMRGRRQWRGRTYVNRTSGDFHFNRNDHEPPEVEAAYTLTMYEALRTIRGACDGLGLGRDAVEAIFHDNAARLIDGVVQAKADWS